MKWLLWRLEGNVTAIVLAVLIVAAVISAAIFGIPVPGSGANGFGPDWECTSHPRGEQTCIKKLKP